MAQTEGKDYGAILEVEELGSYVKGVMDRGKPFAFDIETGYDGPDKEGLSLLTFHPLFKVVGISFTDDPSWARYVPIAHDEGPNVPALAVARVFWSLLNTGQGVPHNAMFELQGMSRFFMDTLSDDPFFGKQVRERRGLYPVLSDTMIEASMVQLYAPLVRGQGVGVGLKGLVKHIFKHEMTEFNDLFPEEDSELGPGTPKRKNRKILRFNSRKLAPAVIEYGCEDSAWTLALHLKHYPQIKDNTMFQVEIALLQSLCEMEKEGLVLDWDEYERQAILVEDFKNSLNEEIQTDLSERLGELVSVNFNSSAQVQELLYEKMQLPVQYNKKTEKPTTDENAVMNLIRITDDPSLKKILEWRGVSKLLSAYINKYLRELRYDPSGRARPSHNQLGAGTGRFSVDGVSYQQWPKPYHFELRNGRVLDLNYRNFLTSPEGFRIIGFDFAQVEMRVLAGVAGETSMLEAFANGEDLHIKTASVMFGVPIDEVTPKQRQAAKGLNFGILYGQGAAALADALGVSKDEAQELLEDYFAGFPKLRAWMDAQVSQGRNTGSVYTPFGRQFKVWNYEDAKNLALRAERIEDPADKKSMQGLARYVHSEGDRLCVNAAIQGGAADYLKLGMVRAKKAIKDAGLEDKVRLVMTIHDALEFYVHESVSTQEVIDLVNPMVSFPVPGFPEIRADWHEGARWGEVLEIKLDDQKQITHYEYEEVLPDKRKFAGEFSTLEEGLKWIEALPELIANTPLKDEAPEKSSEILLIEMSGMPNAESWGEVKLMLAENDDGPYEVWVKVGEQQKSLNLKSTGSEKMMEDLRFILPEANFRVVSLEEVR